jgi:transcriptional regulator with XRE-family HTH domain
MDNYIGLIMYGENIRKLLREKGINQTSLAKKMGIPQGVISRYLNDKVEIPAYRLMAIAQFLHVSIDKITGYHDPPDADKMQIAIKQLDLLDILRAKGFSDEVLELVKLLHDRKLEDWEIKALKTLLKQGGKIQ